MARRKKTVTLSIQGDHGPQTTSQNHNAELVPMEGKNPNNVYIKRTKNVLKEMHMKRRLTMRQYQAGSEIQEAYAGTEMLSSGSPLKEKVDSTPRPDRFIAAQVDAQSRLNQAMKSVRPDARAVVECVCWYNSAIRTLGRNQKIQTETLQKSLDKVANVMGY